VISYLVGDATDPQVPGNKVIAHVCNDVGSWGRGFVLSLSKRWPTAETAYRRWHLEQDTESFPPLKLGEVQLVPVAHVGSPPNWSRTYVANMVAQHGVGPNDEGVPPIRCGALEECLNAVRLFVQDQLGYGTVHMPRIGCGLAGGRWSDIEPIVQRALTGIDVYVYDFDTGDGRTVPWTQ
jgi:O-acetyl-ADP-ribose deacetylase (regulator of RNase III)